MAQVVTASLKLEKDFPQTPSVARFGRWAMPFGPAVFFLNLATSILFLLFGPYSNFAAAGYLDPWFYTGYFTHFTYMVSHFGATYYASRLPWIIPGVLVFKIAPPMAASVLLNALICAFSGTALFFIVYWSYGPFPAVLASIVLVTNPYFMSTISWDYPDGPAIAYAFAALALFAHPPPVRFKYSMGAGIAFALCAATNLAAIPVLLGILVVPVWRYKRDPKAFVHTAVGALSGAILTSAILIILSKWLLNLYQFYLPQVRMIEYVRAHPDYLANMWGTGNAWIPKAYRLGPALFTVFAGGAVLFRRSARTGIYLPVYLCWITTFGLLCLFEFGFHNVSLRVAYVGSYMVCPLMACAGLLIGEAMFQRDARSKPSAAGYVIAAALAAFGIALPVLYAQSRVPPISFSEFWIGLAVLSLVTPVLLAVPRRSRIFGTAACGLIFIALFLGPARDQALGYVWTNENADVFQTLMRIEGVIDSSVPRTRTVRFWYDLHEPASNLFDSAYSLYLWAYFDFTKQLPSAREGDIKRLVDSNTTFAHLTLNTDKTAERTRLLAERGIIVGNQRSAVMHSQLGDIHLVLQDVVDDSKLH
ncbi:MAG: hypothetical protein JO307_13920 [Bryobacterales bacterium]|nr:hypothetical protein [Bryobacterales bacterium]MBV9397520.1 hypothetical protein [Bryobacterales bacterium]